MWYLFDPVSDRGAGTLTLTLAILTFSRRSKPTQRPIQEILTDKITRIRSQRRRRTTQRTTRIITSPRTPINRLLTLYISGRTRSRSTIQPTSTTRPVRDSLINRTCRRVARTRFLWIARCVQGRPTYFCGGRELTVLTTIVVGVVADGAGGEFTGCGIAAGVAATTGGAAAVAFFAFFDDAVAAFAGGDEGHVFVGGGFGEETVADVADGAGRETVCCVHGRGIHL